MSYELRLFGVQCIMWSAVSNAQLPEWYANTLLLCNQDTNVSHMYKESVENVHKEKDFSECTPVQCRTEGVAGGGHVIGVIYSSAGYDAGSRHYDAR